MRLGLRRACGTAILAGSFLGAGAARGNGTPLDGLDAYLEAARVEWGLPGMAVAVVWHNGGIDGMAAWIGLVADLGLGVVVLTNVQYLDHAGGSDLRTATAYRILDSFLGGASEDWSRRFRERAETERAHAVAERQAVAAARKGHLEPWEGDAFLVRFRHPADALQEQVLFRFTVRSGRVTGAKDDLFEYRRGTTGGSR